MLSDPAKFERFAARVGGTDGERPVALHDQVEGYAVALRQLVAAGWTAEPYGFGRLDAFGHILNAVAGGALHEPQNYRVPDAPVSYPFLWTTPQQRYVQWNGVVSNPIGRNVGQVLGVFGQMNLLAHDEKERFRTTVLADRLLEMEAWVAALEAPKWDKALGELDQDKVEGGKGLYAENCQDCHRDQAYEYEAAEHPAGQRTLKVTMVEGATVGTDPTMLANFYQRKMLPGPFAADGASGPVAAGPILAKIIEGVVQQDFIERDVKPEQQIAYFGGKLDKTGKPLGGWTGSLPTRPGRSPGSGRRRRSSTTARSRRCTICSRPQPSGRRRSGWAARASIRSRSASSRSPPTSPRPSARGCSCSTRAGPATRIPAIPMATALDHEQRLELIEYLKTLTGPPPARYP